LVILRLTLDIAYLVPNLTTLASVLPEIWLRSTKLNGSRDRDHAPFSGGLCHAQNLTTLASAVLEI